MGLRRLSADQDSEHSDLVRTTRNICQEEFQSLLNLKFDQWAADIKNNQEQSNKALRNYFEECVGNLRAEIERMARSSQEMKIKMAAMEKRLEELEIQNRDISNSLQAKEEEVNKVKQALNRQDQNQRLWLLRFKGVMAPDGIESTETSKIHVVEVVNKYLGIKMNVLDLDTAYRIGPIVNGNQTILARFFRRDLADHCVRNRKKLKEKNMAVIEDITRPNLLLLSQLKDHDAIDKHWYYRGRVYGLTNDNLRVPFNILDDIDQQIEDFRQLKKIREEKRSTGNPLMVKDGSIRPEEAHPAEETPDIPTSDAETITETESPRLDPQGLRVSHKTRRINTLFSRETSCRQYPKAIRKKIQKLITQSGITK